MIVERGNVIRNKETGIKEVVFRKERAVDQDKFDFVSKTAHEDGDFSYLCTNEYCRCHQ